jgi:hypothetical protein
LSAGEIAGEAVVFGEVADLGESGFMTDGAAEEGAGGVGGADDGHHDFDEGAFAGAVGTEEAEDFTAVDGEGDAVERVDAAAVDFGDILQVDSGSRVVWGDHVALGEENGTRYWQARHQEVRPPAGSWKSGVLGRH